MGLSKRRPTRDATTAWVAPDASIRPPCPSPVGAGLYPTDPVEAAFVDMAADTVFDSQMKIAPTLYEPDKDKKVHWRRACLKSGGVIGILECVCATCDSLTRVGSRVL